MPVVTVEMELQQDTEAYDQLREKVRMDVAFLTIPESVQLPDMAFAIPIPVVTNRTGVDLTALKAENEDFIAWLQIPGTTIDYPVVSTNDTNYYLNHTFSGKKSYLGTLLSLGKTDYQTPGKNIAIYGHHIRSNKETMFSPLLAYKEQSFYVGHETIYLDSLYHSGEYTIFAITNIHSGDWDPSKTDFISDEDFMSFVQRARSQSLYETGIEVTAKDQILTLTTCDRSYIPTYGRLVVMAVKND